VLTAAPTVVNVTAMPEVIDVRMQLRRVRALNQPEKIKFKLCQRVRESYVPARKLAIRKLMPTKKQANIQWLAFFAIARAVVMFDGTATEFFCHTSSVCIFGGGVGNKSKRENPTGSAIKQLAQQYRHGIERIQRPRTGAVRHPLRFIPFAVIPQSHLIKPSQPERLRDRVDQHRVGVAPRYHVRDVDFEEVDPRKGGRVSGVSE
jgi:hypothetical protein